MRVAVITQYFPTSEQPWAGHSAYQTLRPLAKRCDLKVFYPEGRYPSVLKPKSRTYGSVDTTWQPPDISAEYIAYPVLPLLSRPLNGWSASAALLPAVRSFKPDIVFSYVIYPDGFAATRIGKALRVPIVLTAIGSDLNRISDPLCGYLTRSALRRSAYVTTVSGDLLQTARAMGANSSTSCAVLNGCDTSVFYPEDRSAARNSLNLKGDDEIVLYVGRLDVRKGLLELIEATARLRQTRPKVHLYLVGEGADKPLLTAAAIRHDASRWLTFVPSCPTARVAQWMAAANLVALPSYKEGCPNVVIEALASGRPVVATCVGGIPELLDATSGCLIPPKDIPALASALNRVLSTSWDAVSLSQRHARSWADVADKVYQLLTETLETSLPENAKSGSLMQLDGLL